MEERSCVDCGRIFINTENRFQCVDCYYQAITIKQKVDAARETWEQREREIIMADCREQFAKNILDQLVKALHEESDKEAQLAEEAFYKRIHGDDMVANPGAHWSNATHLSYVAGLLESNPRFQFLIREAIPTTGESFNADITRILERHLGKGK